MLSSGFYQGSIRHRRYFPKRHEFDYKMYWTMLDLDRVNKDFSLSKLWSVNRWNMISYKEDDFHKVKNLTVKESIAETIRKEAGDNFDGKIFLLSHLRYLGFNFNSVSFYFCVQDDKMQYIVSEITNTPWGERHPYVLKCDDKSQTKFLFDFKKMFHISPYIEMEMDYRWCFIFEDGDLRIHMTVLKEENQKKVFDATFTAKYIPFNASNMIGMVIKRPFQPLKMVAGIYWQALKLWLKKVPFIEHPKYISKPNETSHGEQKNG